MVRGDDEFILAQPQDIAKGPPHPCVGRHPPLKGHGPSELPPRADVALEVSRQGIAEPGHDVVVRGSDLLEVDHVRLGKDAAPPGDPRGGLRLQGQSAELLDGEPQT